MSTCSRSGCSNEVNWWVMVELNGAYYSMPACHDHKDISVSPVVGRQKDKPA